MINLGNFAKQTIKFLPLVLIAACALPQKDIKEEFNLIRSETCKRDVKIILDILDNHNTARISTDNSVYRDEEYRSCLKNGIMWGSGFTYRMLDEGESGDNTRLFLVYKPRELDL